MCITGTRNKDLEMYGYIMHGCMNVYKIAYSGTT